MAATGTTVSRRHTRGLAMVEFVVVLPLCLMLLMAVGEFGHAFLQYNTLTKSLRDGARHAAHYAINGQTGVINLDAALMQETKNLVVYQDIAGTGAAILPGFSTNDVTVTPLGSEKVTVTASYAFRPIFGLVPGFGYGSSTTTSGLVFQAAVTMRAL
jgi:Flp pilus assembly protein TadG